jgi:hypothetical protein
VNESTRRRRLRWLLVCAGLFVHGVAVAQTQAPQEPYTPTVGQPGKDAVWVPTSAAMVEKMLDMAKITPRDFVMDLGSGDGRTIIAAGKRGVPGLGVEYNPDLVELSTREAKKQGVADKARFVQGDMYAADISRATVLALFLLPQNLEKLKDKFLALPPGSRIVANTFWIPDWSADETETLGENCDNWCTSLLFIVPAKVEGRWRVDDGKGELSLTQKYQMLTGTYTPASGPATPVEGRLRGNEITLTVGDTEYSGRVNGDTMEGSAKTGADRSLLKATRIR